MAIDILFINPGNHQAIYQSLAKDYSAIEPPTWALLLAQSMRSVDYAVGILDVNAERLSTDAIVDRIQSAAPRLLCFVVYGQNPNSGTVTMSGATLLARALKDEGIDIPISFVGSHMSALPLKVLEDEPAIDIVFCNEGVYALRNLLAADLNDNDSLKGVKGIGIRYEGKPILTEPEQVVPQERMDIDLPGYAWDLLPYKEKPLDLYRAHFWHAEYVHEKRSPFAAIYTSLGCAFKCDFCMINILNRNDNDPIGNAANYAHMRFWSPEFIIGEFDKLVDMGVRTLRISDEMFLLNRKYYMPLCQLLKDRGYGDILSMWAYSRVDTVRDPEYLRLVREAGIKWLALGIESGDRNVRLEVTKGKFQDVDIKEIIEKVHKADIEVIANYLFGLPGEGMASMEKTLDLSLDLCTAAWNGYTAMALPGSGLYKRAIEGTYELPQDYSGYSFHSYDASPLPTDKLSPYQVLKFRDEAFMKYHTYGPFLERVRQKFGEIAVENIEEMRGVRIKRRLIEETEQC